MQTVHQLLLFASILLVTIFLQSCQPAPQSQTTTSLHSPSKDLHLQCFLTAEGTPAYTLSFKDKTVIDTSTLGFDFKDAPSLGKGMKVLNSESSTVFESWEMPWGEQRMVENHFNELTVHLQETAAPNRLVNLHFKVYNDGLGFRYEFPEQNNWAEMVVMDEHTQFNLTGDHTCWWIPGDWDIYEHLYNTTKFSAIDALSKRDHPNLAQTTIPENAVNTPVTMKTADGLHLSFHEANLTNYAGMTLKIDKDKLMMVSELVGSKRLGHKAKVNLPFNTPWRTVQITETAAELIDSKLIVNLNEPNKLGDVSWFKPMKYVGIWWEMHLGKSTWQLEGGKHGATTANAKRFIDFAANNNIGGVLVEGWNTGWEHWIGFEDREGVFDFVTPYADYDLKEVVRYGKEKGVEIIMHHETSAAPRTYEQQLDTAYALMQSLDIHAVKTGYVGKIIPKDEYHHGQWMVNHYRKVLETGAKYQVAINAHEPIKDTGIRRTMPNAISREGLRGQEFNAWASDGGNPPEHLTIVPFTRMLSGPIDFTPGAFNIKLDPYKAENQVNTTLAQQLALYVVLYSPVQMACDLPEHYQNGKHPAFQFIRDVAVDWETSKTLNGEVGEYVTIVRQERGSDNWFLGSVTDENTRDLDVALDFLEEGKKYTATMYLDGDKAHWDDNPTDYKIEKQTVDSKTVLKLHLAAGGGAAVSLIME